MAVTLSNKDSIIGSLPGKTSGEYPSTWSIGTVDGQTRPQRKDETECVKYSKTGIGTNSSPPRQTSNHTLTSIVQISGKENVLKMSDDRVDQN